MMLVSLANFFLQLTIYPEIHLGENAATRSKHVFGENLIGKAASMKRLADKKIAEAKAMAAKAQKMAGKVAEKVDQVTDLIS